MDAIVTGEGIFDTSGKCEAPSTGCQAGDAEPCTILTIRNDVDDVSDRFDCYPVEIESMVERPNGLFLSLLGIGRFCKSTVGNFVDAVFACSVQTRDGDSHVCLSNDLQGTLTTGTADTTLRFTPDGRQLVVIIKDGL